MKTPIVFEKEDILKLVYAFLKTKGFAIPSPDKVTYKGALEVRVNIEYDLPMSEVEEALSPKVVVTTPAPKKPITPPVEPVEEAEPDMSAILHQSQNLAQRPAPYGIPPALPAEPEDRPLGDHESFEYPKG